MAVADMVLLVVSLEDGVSECVCVCLCVCVCVCACMCACVSGDE